MQLPFYDGPHPAQSEPFFVQQIEEMKRELTAARDAPGLDKLKVARNADGTFTGGQLSGAFLTHFNAALACFDRIIDFVVASDGTDKQIKCTKGCSNCCIDLVRGVTTAETVNIYHHVRSWPDVRQLFEYHKESAEIFTEILYSKLQPGEMEFGGGDARVEESHREYNLKNRACGFLDRESGCCRIYPVRPIACRYFFSLDPPETCSPTHEMYFKRNTATVHLPQEVHNLLIEIGQRFGFRPLNYLSGAFCGFSAEIMRTRPITVV